MIATFHSILFISEENTNQNMDQEISNFLLSTKAKQTIYKDKSDTKRLKIFIAENYKENNSGREIENNPSTGTR